MVHLPSDRFHRHSLAQLLARSIQLLMQDFVGFTKLSLILVVPSVVFNAFYFKHLHDMIMASVSSSSSSSSSYNDGGYNNGGYNNQDDEEAAKFVSEFQNMMKKLAWLILFIFLVTYIVKAAIIRTTAQAFIPAPVTIMNNLRHGLNRLPQMLLWVLLYIVGLLVYALGVGIVIGLIVVVASLLFNSDVGSLLYIVLQVANLFLSYYIALVLVFCMPIIVVERTSAWSSFYRAWEMAEGHRCMVLCSLFVLMLAAVFVFALEFALFKNMGWTVLAIVHGVTTIVWIPLGTILITLLYLNVRIDKEGLNEQVLTSELFKGDADIGLATRNAESSLDSPSKVGLASSYEPVTLDDDKNDIV